MPLIHHIEHRRRFHAFSADIMRRAAIETANEAYHRNIHAFIAVALR